MRILTQYITTIILVFGFSISAFSINYFSSGDAAWGASGFPTTIPFGDTVFINAPHSITTSGDISIEGALIIDTLSSLIGNHAIEIDFSGAMHNSGIVNITDEMHIDGSLFNTSFINVEKLHNDGYMCNAGIVELEPGEKFDFHGGEIECCGIILADVIKIHNNTGVSLNGNPVSLMDCQTLCGTDQVSNPNFENPVSEAEFLTNAEPSESLINPANTTLCSITPLGVDLILFEANFISNDKVELHWVTATERNNDYFTIESSTNGQEWIKVASVTGAGNSSIQTNYLHFDHDLTPGERYYRISQTDFDGTFEYFKVISLTIENLNEVTCLPNPTSNSLNLIFKNSVNINDMKVYESSGKNVTNQIQITQANHKHFKLNVQQLNSGVYYISINENQTRFIIR